MLVTVAICTFNRAESLRRTLDSLAAMAKPSDLAWEIIIVNNNSTDHTDDVICEYRDRLPVRREFEPRPGLSNARNRAIDTAKGDYILWTDDDVVVGTGWLRAYVDAARRWPVAAVFGGPIRVKYEAPAAKWLLEAEPILREAYAFRDLGNEIQPLSVAEYRVPYGANFVIRAKEQRECRYDPNLGLAPNRRRYYEEIDVIVRLLQSGAAGYWIPDAIVDHCIGRERQTIRHIIAYYTGLAETECFRDAGMGVPNPSWFGVPRRLWLQLVRGYLRYHIYRLIYPAPVWVPHLQAYASSKGFFWYWWQQRGQPSGYSARTEEQRRPGV